MRGTQKALNGLENLRLHQLLHSALYQKNQDQQKMRQKCPGMGDLGIFTNKSKFFIK